jgi:sodium/hydrogen antiporter
MDTLGFAAIAAGIIAFALFAKRLENTFITPPLVFAAFGLIIGDSMLGLADLKFDNGLIHGLAEITLILVLFSDAARIDLRLLRSDHDLPVRMLLIGMPLIIVLGTVAALALPLGLSFWEAALLAAILAPTDAALGQAVVSSRFVPLRIRQTLNVESGLNDGIALPFVLIFAFLAGAPQAGSDQGWLLFGAKQVILGPLAGVAVGAAGAWLLDLAAKKGWTTPAYEGPAILGLAFLAYSGSELIGGNGFIAAFVSGLVFGHVVRGRCGFVFEFAEAEGNFLVLVTFLIFGAAILPTAFGAFDWTVLLYAVLSLTVIRMIPIAIALTGSGLQGPSVAFLGWFGPRGLASILFALFVLEEVPVPAGEHIAVITIVTVALSIVLHGVSAAPLSRRYGERVARMDEAEETKPVSEMPLRGGSAP